MKLSIDFANVRKSNSFCIFEWYLVYETSKLLMYTAKWN